MPLTAKELSSRWKSPVGKVALRAIEHALRNGTNGAELQGYLRGLPGLEEVAPALDLRGIALPELVAARKSDLSGARFDAAKLNWNFGGSVLRGANFDRAEGRNVDFGGCDLSGSSFRNATLPGAVFFGAQLNDANLERIKMRSGQLKAAKCRTANFAGADLRQVWAAEADLRGANLADANLIGASLGKAQWDAATRCDRAELSPEGTPIELIAYALSQGATVRSEKPEWEMALLDATRKALENENGDGALKPVIEKIGELRAKVERDPSFKWGGPLREDLSDAQRASVDRAVRLAANNIGALLG